MNEVSVGSTAGKEESSSIGQKDPDVVPTLEVK